MSTSADDPRFDAGLQAVALFCYLP